VLSWGVLSCGIFAVKGIMVFRGLERDPSDVWSLTRFHVSLSTSISKIFYICSTGTILQDRSPFL